MEITSARRHTEYRSQISVPYSVNPIGICTRGSFTKALDRPFRHLSVFQVQTIAMAVTYKGLKLLHEFAAKICWSNTHPKQNMTRAVLIIAVAPAIPAR